MSDGAGFGRERGVVMLVRTRRFGWLCEDCAMWVAYDQTFGPDRTILVDLADVKRAVTMLKPLVKGNPFVSLTSDGHNVTVTSPTGESMACPDTAWHGNQWPNTAMLLAPYVGYAKGDASRSGTARIGLSPKLMARFAKLSAVRSTETPLRVELTDDLKPVMVFYEPTDDAWDNRQVLWMPVRLAG